MVFAGIFLFSLDKLLRIIQSRPQTCILSAKIFPCKAIQLTLPKHPSKISASDGYICFLVLKLKIGFSLGKVIEESVSDTSDRKYKILFRNLENTNGNFFGINYRTQVCTYKCDICEGTKHIKVSVAPIQHSIKLKH